MNESKGCMGVHIVFKLSKQQPIKSLNKMNKNFKIFFSKVFYFTSKIGLIVCKL